MTSEEAIEHLQFPGHAMLYREEIAALIEQQQKEIRELQKDRDGMSWLEKQNFRPEDMISLLSEINIRQTIDTAMKGTKE